MASDSTSPHWFLTNRHLVELCLEQLQLKFDLRALSEFTDLQSIDLATGGFSTRIEEVMDLAKSTRAVCRLWRELSTLMLAETCLLNPCHTSLLLMHTKAAAYRIFLSETDAGMSSHAHLQRCYQNGIFRAVSGSELEPVCSWLRFLSIQTLKHFVVCLNQPAIDRWRMALSHWLPEANITVCDETMQRQQLLNAITVGPTDFSNTVVILLPYSILTSRNLQIAFLGNSVVKYIVFDEARGHMSRLSLRPMMGGCLSKDLKHFLAGTEGKEKDWQTPMGVLMDDFTGPSLLEMVQLAMISTCVFSRRQPLDQINVPRGPREKALSMHVLSPVAVLENLQSQLDPFRLDDAVKRKLVYSHLEVLLRHSACCETFNVEACFLPRAQRYKSTTAMVEQEV